MIMRNDTLSICAVRREVENLCSSLVRINFILRSLVDRYVSTSIVDVSIHVWHYNEIQWVNGWLLYYPQSPLLFSSIPTSSPNDLFPSTLFSFHIPLLALQFCHLLLESRSRRSSREPLVASVNALVSEFLPRYKKVARRRDKGRGEKTYSIRRRALYFATRSERAGAPVLIWPTPRPTTTSAMTVFSVSPLRWETMTDQPTDCASWAL